MTPTVVLVHGAGHGAWSWDGVRERLALRSVAVDLFGDGDRAGLSATATGRDFVDAVVADLASEVPEGDVVLVGHSMGGVLIPMIAGRLPGRVAHLLFVAVAFTEGRRPIDHLPLGARLPIMIDARRRKPKGTLIPRWVARRAFCNDMTDEQADAVLGRLVRQPSQFALEKLHFPDSSRGIPRTYLWFSNDPSMSEQQARATVENLGGAKFVTIDAGHDGIITKPAEVADVIQGIASSAA